MILVLFILAVFCGHAFAQTTDDNFNSAVVEEIFELIKTTTPEERQEILEGLFWYMLLFDGEDSLSTAFEGLNETSDEDASNSADIDTASETTATVDFPIIFKIANFEAYITAWKSCNFYDGDIGYEFSITVYNNSDKNYEFGVKDIKVNGWNVIDDGFYDSIIKLKAGEKTRCTWQVDAIGKKAGLNSLDEVEKISGRFFVGDAEGWGNEKFTENITITRSDIDQLLCKD